MSWSPQQQFSLESLRTQKPCRACLAEKPLSDFPPDRRGKDGRQARCRDCINSWMKEHYRKKPAEHMLRRAKSRARTEGMEFDLTLDDIMPLPEVCPVLGVQLRISTRLQDPNAYSLDRVDNAKGYVRGNVAVMSYRANRLKNDGSAAEHEAIAAWMREQKRSASNDNTADRVTVVI